MNKQAFINLLKKPEAISERDLEALEELTGSFPFCQIAHTLIAKAHYDKSSMLVHQKIKKASAYSLNRALLKKVIVGNTTVESAFGSDTTANTSPSNADADNTDAPPIVNSAATQKTNSDPEQRIGESLANSNKPSSVADDVLASIARLKEMRKDFNSGLITPTSNHIDNNNINSVHPVIVPELGTNLNEDVVRRTPETKNSSEFNSPKDKKFQNELIERFIVNNPRLTPGFIDDRPTSTDDLASASSKLNETIVSENLAIIFTKQGKISKAKEIYKKLSLKYPEKAAYFAGKIDNLENK